MPQTLTTEDHAMGRGKVVPKILDFLMGTDPEFVVATKQGDIIRAADYVPSLQDDPDAEFGADGHPYLLELRVPPGNPAQLVEGVKNIISRNKHRMPEDIVWLAGSYKCDRPIGGHIHFGVPFQERFGLALDFALSQILILLENASEAMLRRADGSTYGCLYVDKPANAIRTPPHGFEYRTPPSFYLSPTISLGVLGLAKAAMYEELADGPNRFARVERKYPTESRVPIRDFRRANRKVFYARFPTVWGVVSQYLFWKTPEGRELWRYVANLKRIVEQIVAGTYEDWDNNKDLLHRWDLRRTDLTLKNLPQPVTHVEIPAGRVGVDTLWNILFTDLTETITVAPEVPVAQAANTIVYEDDGLMLEWGTDLEEYVMEATPATTIATREMPGRPFIEPTHITDLELRTAVREETDQAMRRFQEALHRIYNTNPRA